MNDSVPCEDERRSDDSVPDPTEVPQILAIHRRQRGWGVTRRELMAQGAGLAAVVGCNSQPQAPPAPAPRHAGVPVPGPPGGIQIQVPCGDRLSHHQTISVLAGSPDGRYLASADEAGTLKIWSVDPPALVQQLPDSAQGVRILAFDVEQERLCAVRDAANFVWWDLRTGKKNETRFPGDVAIEQVVWCRLSARSDPALLCRLADGTCWVHDLSTAKNVTEDWQMAAAVATMAVSHRGEFLALGRSDGSLEIRRLDAPQSALILDSAPDAQPRAIAFDPPDEYLAVGTDQGSVRIYRIAERLLLQAIPGEGIPVTALAFDGPRLTVVYADKSCQRWPVRKILLEREPDLDVTSVVQCAWSRSGSLLLAQERGELFAWDEDGATGKVKPMTRVQQPQKLMAGDEPDEWLVAAAGHKLWRLSTSNPDQLRPCSDAPSAFQSVTYDPSNQTLFCASATEPVTAIRLNDGTPIGRLGETGCAEIALAVSPLGDRVVAVSAAGGMESWKWPGGAPEGTWSKAPDRIEGVAFSADHRYLGARSANGQVAIWSCALRNVVSFWALPEQDAPALEMAFEPEGHFLVVSDQVGVAVWHVREGRCAGRLESPATRVTQLAINPRGDRLAGITERGTVCMWRRHPLDSENTYSWGSSGVQVAALSPAGDRLFIAAGNAAGIWNFAENVADCLIDFDINYNDVQGYSCEEEYAGKVIILRVTITYESRHKDLHKKETIVGKRTRPAPPPPPSPPQPTTYSGPSTTTYTTYSYHYWRPN